MQSISEALSCTALGAHEKQTGALCHCHHGTLSKLLDTIPLESLIVKHAKRKEEEKTAQDQGWSVCIKERYPS